MVSECVPATSTRCCIVVSGLITLIEWAAVIALHYTTGLGLGFPVTYSTVGVRVVGQFLVLVGVITLIEVWVAYNRPEISTKRNSLRRRE